MFLVRLVLAAAAAFLIVGMGRSALLQYRRSPRVFKYLAMKGCLGVAAVLSLSGCFATFRRLDGERLNPHPILNLLFGSAYVVILVVSFLVLGFFAYRDDHRGGKLKRRLRLYDKFLEI